MFGFILSSALIVSSNADVTRNIEQNLQFWTKVNLNAQSSVNPDLSNAFRSADLLKLCSLALIWKEIDYLSD